MIEQSLAWCIKHEATVHFTVEHVTLTYAKPWNQGYSFSGRTLEEAIAKVEAYETWCAKTRRGNRCAQLATWVALGHALDVQEQAELTRLSEEFPHTLARVHEHVEHERAERMRLYGHV